MRSVYITTAEVKAETGGGNVAFHEIKALKPSKVLSLKDLYPPNYGLPDTPFLYDYLAMTHLENCRVDHVHFYGNPFGFTAQKLKENGATVSVTVPAHNLELSIEEFQRLGMTYPFRHMTDPFLWSLYTKHIKLADTVICPSKLSAEYIKHKLSLANKIIVIPHGCTLPEEVPPFPSTFTVGHLSQCGPDKGQIYLVQAWNSLKLNAKIIIAGAGTESLGGVGYVQDASSIYKGCSVYVQSSVTEGFSLSVLEAMAFGRPVIVTDGCGVAEIIEDGEDGFIVPIRNPEALAKKILYFFSNPLEVERMGRVARLKAERYGWDEIEEEYAKLFEST